MTDQPLPPQFVDDEPRARPVRPATAPAPDSSARVERRPTDRALSFWATLDKPLLIIVGVLLSLGLIMVYSTTFYWADLDLGGTTVKVMEQARNVAIGLAAALVVILFDYRRVRRLAVLILLVSIASLVGVLIFGDDVFNARRSLIAGRLQPGEFAELAMIIYMAAWLGSKNARIRSITYGLIPYAVLVGLVSGLVVLQPDLSTAIIIFVVCGAMFFLAGADMVQIAAAAALSLGAGVIAIVTGVLPTYAADRFESFAASLGSISDAHPHTFQAYIAFVNGGWTGRGLGESLQKFNNALPAPHTDSIFAVIGEELGIIGAGVVVFLFIFMAARGFQIAQRAGDPFGALLAAGVTIWIIAKALLNIAVMLSLVPPTGVVLPFISFGGSSLVTLMIGVGLLLSVQRASILRENAPERRVTSASFDRSRRDGRARVSRAGRGRGDADAAAGG
jgi:cell division protein FtsW